MGGIILMVTHAGAASSLDWPIYILNVLVAALAFLADGYLPPSPGPVFDISNALVMTKRTFGYELYGYWLFFVEDGTDKIIEAHVCPFPSTACT